MFHTCGGKQNMSCISTINGEPKRMPESLKITILIFRRKRRVINLQDIHIFTPEMIICIFLPLSSYVTISVGWCYSGLTESRDSSHSHPGLWIRTRAFKKCRNRIRILQLLDPDPCSKNVGFGSAFKHF